TAVELGLAEWMYDLQLLKDKVMQYRLESAELWPAVDGFHEAYVASESARVYVEQAETWELRQREVSANLERRAAAAEAALQAVSQSADSGFAEMVEKIARSRERLAELS